MNLQSTGERIVLDLQLEQLLSRFGEAHLVGNLALGTTIKPDIDYLVYLDRDRWLAAVQGIKEQLPHLPVAGERELKESGKYLITFEYSLGDTAWSIDITFSEKTGDYLTDSYQFWLDFHEKFTPEVISRILPLKKYFYDKKMLRNSMSYYIYRAVIDEGARTVADIYDYLKRNKVYLGKFKNHD